MFGTDSFLARPRKKMFLADCGEKEEWRWAFILGVHLSPLLPLSFSTLVAFDRSNWPRCLLWHGWLPGLVVAGERDPWSTSYWDLACCELERRLGAYPGDTSAFFWTPPEHWDADDIALEMSDTPNIWTDGSTRKISPRLGGFEVAGAGVYVPASELAFEGSVWGTAEEYGDARLERCRCFSACPWATADYSACLLRGCHHCSAVLLALSFRY